MVHSDQTIDQKLKMTLCASAFGQPGYQGNSKQLAAGLIASFFWWNGSAQSGIECCPVLGKLWIMFFENAACGQNADARNCGIERLWQWL